MPRRPPAGRFCAASQPKPLGRVRGGRPMPQWPIRDFARACPRAGRRPTQTRADGARPRQKHPTARGARRRRRRLLTRNCLARRAPTSRNG
eukprot:11171612-Lingulodinium_polyedra.AAC.1